MYSEVTAKRKVRISSDWFDNNIGKTFYIGPLPKGGKISHSKDNFVPQSILVNGSANYAKVEGCLWDENEKDFEVYTLEVGVIHHMAFRAIRENHTSHREVTILS